MINHNIPEKPIWRKILSNGYFQVFTGILLGIVLTIYFKDENGFLKIFHIIGFLILLAYFMEFLDVLSGEKTGFKKALSNITYPLIVGLFLGIITLGLKISLNTINSSDLSFKSGLYGSFFGLFYEVLMSKKTRKLSFGGILLSSLLLFPLLFISIASMINAYKTDEEPKPVECIVLRKESDIDEKDQKDSQYWIVTNVDDFYERFSVKVELWKTLKRNDTIILFVKNGNLGYRIVERIEKKSDAGK